MMENSSRASATTRMARSTMETGSMASRMVEASSHGLMGGSMMDSGIWANQWVKARRSILMERRERGSGKMELSSNQVTKEV